MVYLSNLSLMKRKFYFNKFKKIEIVIKKEPIFDFGREPTTVGILGRNSLHMTCI